MFGHVGHQRAASGQSIGQVGVVASHDVEAVGQQAVQVPGLGLSLARLGLVVHQVTLDDSDLVEMVAEHPGRQQAGHAAA